MSLIDLLTIEYRSLFPARKKTSGDFTDEITALCSLLDKRGVYAPGASSHRVPDPVESEEFDLEELGVL